MVQKKVTVWTKIARENLFWADLLYPVLDLVVITWRLWGTGGLGVQKCSGWGFTSAVVGVSQVQLFAVLRLSPLEASRPRK
eukprot:4111925-Amphidinium_carterae.1